MPHPANELVASLPRAARGGLLGHAESMQMEVGQVLSTLGRPTQYVYFPDRGCISMSVTIDAQPGLEIGMVGPEGMLGAHTFLAGRHDPIDARVLGGGSALRIAVASFRDELARSPRLRDLMERYLEVSTAQRATVAGCMHSHAIGPRLARWLLMNQDRRGVSRFAVTQEFMSTLLGVRRVSVSQAAHRFQRDGLIEYRRGDMTILNRPGLESASCSCYAADLRSYAMQMRPGGARRLPSAN